MRTFRPILVATGLVAALAAQGTNCNLLGTFNNHGPFNDCWGYTAPNGDEYALLGATTGTVVIDITNPAAPVERGWFPWANSSWRDIRTYGHYAYVVTEATAGFMIIDLQNPNAPVSLGTFGTANSNNAHDVCVDTGAGKLYLVGCNTGTPVYDLTVNPANPSFMGFAAGGGNSNYFHDMCVENGYAYGAMIYNGVLRIWDVSNFPPTTLSNSATPGNFTHNAWPNAAGTVCVTTDEVTGGVVKFFDITNKSNPLPLGQFTPNPASIPHNAYIVGNLCHVAWYTEGYRCIDITDPNNPVEVASYDTWPGASGGYNGNWGCYPFLPSGNILVSDRSTGLYIVKPVLTDLTITHTPLGDTTNEDGPYGVLCDVTSSNPISAVNMNWRVGGTGAFTTVPMVPTGNPGQYLAGIPGQDAPEEVQYYIEATDSVGTKTDPATGHHSFFIGTYNYVFNDDLESGAPGWTHGTTAVQDDWQLGSSAGRSGTSGPYAWQDPLGAYSGANIWGNDLGGSGFNGSYQNNNANWLQSPLINTNGVQNLRLRFRRWLQLAPGDTGTVRVNGIPVYTNSAGINDSSWALADIDISSIANTTSQLTIRFELNTDGSGVSGGWSLDDIQVVQISDSAPPLIYGTGDPGTNGIPAISLGSPACIGLTADVQGSNMLANAGAFLVMNFVDDNTPVYGITALVQSAGAAVLFGSVSGSGLVNYPFPVPNNPVFDNLYIYSQIIVLDPAGAQGLAATPGMRFRICLQ